MTSASAFSSPGEDAIKRTIDVNPDENDVLVPETEEDLALFEEVYDVEWTVQEIISREYKQIALQFPDELLHISVPVYQCLKKRLSPDTALYILADTSYGSCCVDEVTAQHVNADLIVHYGYSCLSSPSRLPVLFVFPKKKIDIKLAVDALLDTLLQQQDNYNVILIPDVAYAHVSDNLYDELQSSKRLPPSTKILYKPIPRRASPDSRQVLTQDATQVNSSFHRRYILPEGVSLSSCVIIYIGSESLGLTNLLMTHPDNTVISYNPSNHNSGAKIESARTNKLLMRRYAIVQRARDADIFGILVGTLGVSSYLPLISHLRDLIRKQKRKSYTLTVGKLNPAKLANFADIECFVLVACPENSLIESKEFYRPIITPFELFLALNDEPIWPGNYILDFEHVIEMQKSDDNGQELEDGDKDKDPDRPMFSLTTGKYRYVKKYETEDATPTSPGESSSELIIRNTDTALTNLASNAGVNFLREKTFKGLEQRLGQDLPSVLKHGRSGIARDYNEQS